MDAALRVNDLAEIDGAGHEQNADDCHAIGIS